MKSKYIFGYGSLMNPKSLKKTLPGKRSVRKVILLGYQRKINARVNGYLYLNLVPSIGYKVEGILIYLNQKEFNKIKKREIGYTCSNITKKLDTTVGGEVFTFIVPNKKYPKLEIPRSYINTCLAAIPKSKQITWLKETIIKNKIKEDSS